MILSSSARRAVPILALSILLGACSVDSQAQQPAPVAPAAAGQVPQVPASSGVVAALPNFAPLVDKFGPAVGNVDVVQNPQQTSGPGGGQGEDPFSDFFRRFGIPGPEGRGGGTPQPQRGSGSGFVVTPDG